MSRVICMIPARLGSKRVIKKNLRMLAGKPLIAYAIEAAKASDVFDEIYVNSEAEELGRVAQEYGATWYERPSELASDATTNDPFVLDFLQHVSGDICIQLLPTSPLITPEEIRSFVSEMMNKKYDTLISVANHQIASVYQGKPINFSVHDGHRSSQTMTLVQSYATVLMGWTYRMFLENMKKYGGAYHGGDGTTGYFAVGGLTMIDIDHEDDFALAEVALQYRANPLAYEKRYYEPRPTQKERSEIDVPTILKKDGVMQCDFAHENMSRVNVDEIIESMDNSVSWCRRLVNTESNSATLISQLPGEGNRLHYHPNWNEWWYIVRGEWKWTIEGKDMVVKKGDFVFMPKNTRHCITAVGTTPAVRLAVSRADVPHVYIEE